MITKNRASPNVRGNGVERGVSWPRWKIGKWLDKIAYEIFYWRWQSILQNNPQLGKWMAHYILEWYELNEKKDN